MYLASRDQSSNARSVLSSCAASDKFGARAERAYGIIKLTQFHVLSLASWGNYLISGILNSSASIGFVDMGRQ